MKINNLVKFNDKCLFDGAVQLDWLYDNKLNKDVALSYVFHGPKYHGVSNKGINAKYSLIDTASFVEEINNKLYTSDVGNKFILAISSYGTGKSHLSVTMSNLFADGAGNGLSNDIISRIKDADNEIGSRIERTIKGRNLIITINGVKDSNLNSLVLESAKKALKRDGINESVLEDATISIKKAKEFLERSYEDNSNKYIDLIKKYTSIEVNYYEAKEFILKSLSSQLWAFEIINEVFSDITGGSEIRMDGTFSAGEILSILNKKLVEETNTYNKILVIFDEFGRFIEYAASYPRVAGDSALQQIYESVQNANGNIIFLGFIQFDIETYMSRVVDNKNISKYVGRYKFADKKYLSSNLETIFANLLQKDSELYPIYVENIMNSGFKIEAEKQHRNICRWIKSIELKDVWSNYNLYNKVILKGCYPFHPLSIWLLTNLSTWMQDRSTINYLSEAFNKKSKEDIVNGYLSFIYPKDIISDEFIKEIRGAEEKGLQQSNYCTLYYNIESQMKNKLQQDEIDVLKAILIINILGIKPYDKEDLRLAISYCTGFDEKKINEISNNLENEHGVIVFNPSYNVYDFSIETNGKSEFIKIKLLKTKRKSESEVIDFLNNSNELKETIRLNVKEETDFGFDFINSTEWKFDKAIESVEDITDGVISHYIGKINRDINGDNARGQVIFVYVNNKNESYLSNVVDLIKKYNLKEQSIIFKVIRDMNKNLYDSLNEYITLLSFSNHDKEKFGRFYKDDLTRVRNSITKSFTILNTKGTYLTEDGEISSSSKLKEACKSKFKQVYYNLIPFKFDGFDKINKSAAIKYHSEIVDGLINGEFKNKNIADEVKPDISNRLKGLFGSNIFNSWDALGSNSNIVKPRRQQIVDIFNQVEIKINEESKVKIGILFKKYLQAPYGMNEFSLCVLIAVFLYSYSGRVKVSYNNKYLTPADIIKHIYEKKKISIDKMYLLDIELLEENQEELFYRIIEEGTNLNDISKCNEFLEYLEIKIKDTVLFGEYKQKIDFIKGKMIEGKNKYERVQKFSSQLEGYLVEFEKLGAENSYDAILLLEKIISSYSNLKNSTKFSEVYNFKVDEEIQQLFKKVSMLLKGINLKKVKNTFELVKCNDYKDFHNISIETKGLIDKLSTGVLKELCNTITEVLKEKENSLKQIEKNRKIIDSIHILINDNQDLSNKRLEHLNKISDNIKDILPKLQSIDISDSVKDKLKDELKKIEVNKQLELDKRKDNINKQINDIYNLNSKEDIIIKLSDIESNVKLLNNNELSNNLISLKNDIKNLDIEMDKISKMNRQEVEENLIYSGKFVNIMNSFIISIQNKWKNKEESWISKVNFNNIDENLDKDINDLHKLKYELESAPNYLSENTQKIVYEKISIIDYKIKKKSIEWVVQLFGELEEQDKKQCLEIIKNKYSII